MENWAKKVNERTDGLVTVETFPGGSLLKAPAMFDGVLAGTADIGCSCPSYEPGRFPLLLGMESPAVKFPNDKTASRVLWEITREFQPASLADFKMVYMYNAGPNHIETIKKVETLKDLKGLELRTSGAVTPIMKALGAAPVGMPQSEVPEALQKGVVKGYVSSEETLLDFKYYEICKYGTDWSPCIGCLFAVVMNKDTWNSLPADVQKVIDNLSVEQSEWTGIYMDNHTLESIKAAEENGWQRVVIADEEKAKWDALLQPLVDKYIADMKAKGLPGEEFLARLAALKAVYK